MFARPRNRIGTVQPVLPVREARLYGTARLALRQLAAGLPLSLAVIAEHKQEPAIRQRDNGMHGARVLAAGPALPAKLKLVIVTDSKSASPIVLGAIVVLQTLHVKIAGVLGTTLFVIAIADTDVLLWLDMGVSAVIYGNLVSKHLNTFKRPAFMRAFFVVFAT